MKFVVACCWSPDEGQGISTISREIAEGLVKQGDEVYYLSPKPKNFTWYEKTGISPIFIGSELLPEQGLIAVIKEINLLKPDALINNDHPYVQAAFPALQTRRIVISHAMGWATAALVRFNHQWSDNVIAISNDMLLMLLDKGISPEKLIVIMNGIKDPYIGDWMPTRPSGKTMNLIFAGNWSVNKGANLLLDYILSMPDHMTWLQLNIFGNVKKKFVRKMITKHWVTVHGRVPRQQFLSALSNADVLLFPSKREGCPMTIIEAMSRGVVPVASDGVGAMRWMIDHGIDGFIARRKHWKNELSVILRHLYNNQDILYSMKIDARKRYKKQFDICFMIDRIKEIACSKKMLGSTSNGPYRTIHWHRTSSVNSTLTKKTTNRFYNKFSILHKSGYVKSRKTPTNIDL